MVLLIVAAPVVLLPIGWMLAAAKGLWDSLLHIPYRVDSHVTEYAGDGTVTSRHFQISFMSDGKEIALSHTFRPTGCARRYVLRSTDSGSFCSVESPNLSPACKEGLPLRSISKSTDAWLLGWMSSRMKEYSGTRRP
jgi:hypothetical protein